MENSLYSINNLRTMEVIDITNGAKLGMIRDFKIDCDNYNIISILIPVSKSNWLAKIEQLEIPWEDIVKVGVDVILVKGQIKSDL